MMRIDTDKKREFILIFNSFTASHRVENNDHVCFIAIFPPKLNIEISTL